MVITITGHNFYLMKRRLDELVGKFKDKYGELAVEKIDAEEADGQVVLDAVQSLPFLAPRKMVVVRGASSNPVLSGQIEQILSSSGNTTDVIFYELAPDKRTAIFKVLKAKTQLEEYNELDARGLARWLVEEAKKLGGQLGHADANYLVERAGTNQELLANELDKLLAYNPGITRASIDLLTVKTPQSKVFDLLDAAFGGNKKKALELYDEQRAQKVEPQAIIAMMAWQLELIALAMYDKGKDASQIAKDAGVSPYPLQKARRLAAKLGEDKLKELVKRALMIDEMGKTTPLDLDEALKTYIVTI